MSNTWFRFKEFTVLQQKSAMKVGTDGVLLGSWAGEGLPVRRALDVGTGTGLIALMLAQRFPEASVDAVELDPLAAGEAGENFRNSPWSQRLKLYTMDFRDFMPEAPAIYDLIVSNPPYFRNSLRAVNELRTLARHSVHLDSTGLIRQSVSILAPEGRLCLIVPPGGKEMDAAGSSGLYARKVMGIRTSPGKEVKRYLLEFSRQPGGREEDELSIEEGVRHRYSEAYRRLTADFYLDF